MSLPIISFLFLAYLIVLGQVVSDLFPRPINNKQPKGSLHGTCLIFFIVFTAHHLSDRPHSGMAERQMQSAQEAQEDAEASIQSSAGQGTSPADQISQAKALLDSGAITRRTSTP